MTHGSVDEIGRAEELRVGQGSRGLGESVYIGQTSGGGPKLASNGSLSCHSTNLAFSRCQSLSLSYNWLLISQEGS